MIRYILDENKNTVVCHDDIKWHEWFSDMRNRFVRQTKIGDNYLVSTVCTGVDHSINNDGSEIFETMSFTNFERNDFADANSIIGSDGEICRRYGTWDEALKGHQEVVDMLKSFAYTCQEEEVDVNERVKENRKK